MKIVGKNFYLNLFVFKNSKIKIVFNSCVKQIPKKCVKNLQIWNSEEQKNKTGK